VTLRPTEQEQPITPAWNKHGTDQQDTEENDDGSELPNAEP
jgi:hypothetical protein